MRQTTSRRGFLASLAGGAGGLGLWLAGCESGFFDEEIAVDERFHESRAGHARPPALPADDPESFRFVWCSDLHVTSFGDHALDKIGQFADRTGARLVLHSGDLVDQGLAREYDRFELLVSRYVNVPFISAVGNHDLYNGGWDRFRRRVGPSAFHFGYGPCDFVFIDVANGTVGKDQLEWLSHVLPKLSRRHRFVLGHYPLYEGALQTPGSMGSIEERMALFHLFDRAKIDYYLCGHRHVGDLFELDGTRHVITGAACPDRALSGDENHFYLFEVGPDGIDRKKILVADV